MVSTGFPFFRNSNCSKIRENLFESRTQAKQFACSLRQMKKLLRSLFICRSAGIRTRIACSQSTNATVTLHSDMRKILTQNIKLSEKTMEYKYYPNTIGFITEKLKEKFPDTKSEENLKNIPAHLFWMMEKMQSFDDSAKAGGWIGWIMAHTEILGILDNEKSRELTREDLEEGFI